MKQIEMLVGTLNGIDLNRVSLQNINTTNTMIGIVMVGINLMKKKDPTMVRFENYL